MQGTTGRPVRAHTHTPQGRDQSGLVAPALACLLSARQAPVAPGLSGSLHVCLELTLVPAGAPDPSEAWLRPLKP